MSARRRQSGFTLVELAIAMMLLAILSYSAVSSYSFLSKTQGELATRDRLERVRTAFVAAYRNNARVIEGTVNQEFFLAAGVTIADGTDAGNASTAAALNAIAPFGQLSPYELQVDEFQGRFRFFVSPRLSTVMPGGYTVYYRKVAVVSLGYNNRLDAGTALNAAGMLTVAGDDSAVLIDGFQIQRDLAQTTVERVDRIAKAYQLYFTNRYLANPARDVSIDYFAASGTTPARWDAGGLATNSGGTFVAASTLNMSQAIGVAAVDLLDAYGTAILIDNSSGQTRNPDNGASAMAIPPYSALVRGNLIAGQTYTQSAIGSF